MNHWPPIFVSLVVILGAAYLDKTPDNHPLRIVLIPTYLILITLFIVQVAEAIRFHL